MNTNTPTYNTIKLNEQTQNFYFHLSSHIELYSEISPCFLNNKNIVAFRSLVYDNNFYYMIILSTSHLKYINFKYIILIVKSTLFIDLLLIYQSYLKEKYIQLMKMDF